MKIEKKKTERKNNPRATTAVVQHQRIGCQIQNFLLAFCLYRSFDHGLPVRRRRQADSRLVIANGLIRLLRKTKILVGWKRPQINPSTIALSSLSASAIAHTLNLHSSEGRLTCLLVGERSSSPPLSNSSTSTLLLVNSPITLGSATFNLHTHAVTDLLQQS